MIPNVWKRIFPLAFAVLVATASFAAAQQATLMQASDRTPVQAVDPARTSPAPALRQEPVPAQQPAVEPPRTPRQMAEIRGDIMMARKMFPEAVSAYQALLEQEPKNAVLMNKIGVAYHQQMMLPQAKKYYERAIKADKTFANAINNLGMVYFARGNYRKAIGQFKKALEVRPDLAPAESNLGYAYFQQKKYEEAWAAFQRAVTLDPEVFERRGSSTGSVLQTRSVEDRGFYYYFLAKFFASTGDIERCANYLRKARDEGYKKMAEIPKDPAFAGVIADPRILEALQPNPLTVTSTKQ